MSGGLAAPPGALSIGWDPRARRLSVQGVVRAAEAAELARLLATAPVSGAGLELDLDELELEDGVAVAEAVNGLRALAARAGPVRVREAPQMLAHTLYKVGALDRAAIQLLSTRAEEPTTAN